MNYTELAQRVVNQATNDGVEVEAYIAVGSETNIQVRGGAVEKFSYAGSKGLGVRVIKAGQMGYAYTSDFSDESIAKTIATALTLSEVADADEHRRLPDPKPLSDEDLAIYDSSLLAVDAETKVAFQKAVEAAALAYDDRVQVSIMNSYIDGISEVYLANSKGFQGSYNSTFAGAYIMVMAVDESDRATGFGLQIGRSLNDIDAATVGRQAAEQAVNLLGGKPVPTQTATVVYHPVAATALLGAISQALTAEAMQRNRSFLQGKLGQTVASDVVTLLDNGRLPGGLATRPFDDEGNPTSATRLIDEGVFQAVIYDAYTADRDGTNSTGNATRGSHRAAPSLAPSNFYIQPGPDDADALIAGVEKGLYVINTMNTHSINPVSGDYSVSAQGFWIENGKLTHPVNNVTIALPLGQILQNVRAVGNDLTFLPFGGAIGSPTIRVDNVVIGGV
ncbi:MAG: TldD/PmbA family protein [Caldilineaceae bacterium]|nr:TldD/PmbA family protein [Caldilineaceae bacterium]